MSFLAAAGKKTTDVKQFIRESSDGDTLKYKPEKGMKHIIYIPFKVVHAMDENGQPMYDANQQPVYKKEIVAMSADVHDWTDSAGKYKSSVCLKGVVIPGENDTMINDGTCPFCDNVQKAWDIYRYRFALEEQTCGKFGEELTKHMDGMKKTFADERKAKDAGSFIYLLVAKIKTDSRGEYVLNAEKIPEYELKVMKLSDKRMDKIQQQIENSGSEFEGCELAFEYPVQDDARLVVSQSSTTPVFGNKSFKNLYPQLVNYIHADVEKFSWTGIEKSFPEWEGMSSAAAEKVVKDLFEKWDEYQIALLTNPNARYLENVGTGAKATNPALGAPSIMPQMPGAAPQVPGFAPQAPGVAPQMPGVAPQVPGFAPQVPGVAPGVGVGVGSVPPQMPGVPGVVPQVGVGAPEAPAAPTVPPMAPPVNEVPAAPAAPAAPVGQVPGMPAGAPAPGMPVGTPIPGMPASAPVPDANAVFGGVGGLQI